ncbi:MAG: hypothetical protein ACPLWB_00960 [Caldisericia bacterium]
MKITKIFDDFKTYLSFDKYRIKNLGKNIDFYSTKNFYLLIDENIKNYLKKEKNFKIKFSRKILIKKNEKFLSIVIDNEKIKETSILKLINSIKYDELFKLKDIKEEKIFLIIVKDDFFDDKFYKNLINGIKKYSIFVDEICYIRSYSTLLLEVIDENIFKYKRFLVYFDEKQKDFIYKNLKDSGINKKIDLKSDYIIFKRKNSKVIVFNKKRFYKIVREMIKEEI